MVVNSPEGIVREYFAALSQGDVESVVSLFADDGTVMAEGMSTASGTSALRAVYEYAAASMRIQEVCTVDSVVRDASVAAVRTHSAGTLTILESGTTRHVAFRELFVLRLTNGGWRILEYMFNAEASE
jgi:uncharacterized protein (TIGR02246 family)